jgi:mannose-6-phosphate isomerase-like protein (cupin superfamily)
MEPECEEPFDWSWDNFEPTKDLLQTMVWEESLEFHPEDEETYFVRAGSALVTDDGVDVRLGQGDLVAIPNGAHHKVTNSSNTEVLQLFVTCAEPWTPECSVFLE